MGAAKKKASRLTSDNGCYHYKTGWDLGIILVNRCNQEIYLHGEPVAVVADRDADAIEQLVQWIGDKTKQNVDWHYWGGRGLVKCIGNCKMVRDEFRRYANDWLYVVESEDL